MSTPYIGNLHYLFVEARLSIDARKGNSNLGYPFAVVFIRRCHGYRRKLYFETKATNSEHPNTKANSFALLTSDDMVKLVVSLGEESEAARFDDRGRIDSEQENYVAIPEG